MHSMLPFVQHKRVCIYAWMLVHAQAISVKIYKKLVATMIASGVGNWEVGDSGGRESSMSLSPCDTWISYHMYIPLLQERFILGAQFSDQKVLKYPFYLIYLFPSTQFRRPRDYGVGFRNRLFQWSSILRSTASQRASYSRARDHTISCTCIMYNISRDTDGLWVNLTCYLSLLTYS